MATTQMSQHGYPTPATFVPIHPGYSASTLDSQMTVNVDATKKGDVETHVAVVSPRRTSRGSMGHRDMDRERERMAMSRTPSPTPSELRELKTGAIDWKSLTNWRFWIRREWLWYYVALVLILVITALVTIYHKEIVGWLTPVTRWLHGFSFGWIVPIAVLFVISFPPLFGHEIVAILCGLVWGLWIGFGIVAAGTFLGEVGNFYAFKYCCRSRGEKLERTKLSYACLAKVVRDGGFKIALIARLSAIPGHFTTAVFSTCGMGIFVFSLAALLSMPKQFITVYLGVILEQSATGTHDKNSKIISNVVLALTFLITVAAMWYILREMNRAKPDIIYQRRKARQAKLSRAAGFSPYTYSNDSAGSSTDVFNPYNQSDINIPLSSAKHQQWDKHGRAMGYAGDPSLNTPIYSPQPRSGASDTAFLPRSGRDVEEGAGYVHSSRPHRRQDSDEVLQWDTKAANAARTTYAWKPPPIAPSTRDVDSTGAISSTVDPLPPSQGSHHRRAGASVSLSPPISPPPSNPVHVQQPLSPISPFDDRPTREVGFPMPLTEHPVSHTADSHTYSPNAGYDGHVQGHHAQESTYATFRTAYSSSPVSDDDTLEDRRHLQAGPTASVSAPLLSQPALQASLLPSSQTYSGNLGHGGIR